MADSTSFDPRAAVVYSLPKAKPVKRGPSHAMRVARYGMWVSLLVGGVAAIAPIAHFTAQELEAWSLQHADEATITRTLEQDWPASASPDFLETLAELGLQLPTPDLGSAYVAAQRAVSIDPNRAFVWAELAYLEQRRANGVVNEASLNALTRSMDACPLCSEDLVSWRFNFVLSNWMSIPEELRRRAFEQADMLRWMGDNAEFLADMRTKADIAGIPFDTYRSNVNTPARTWDISPSSHTPDGSVTKETDSA